MDRVGTAYLPRALARALARALRHAVHLHAPQVCFPCSVLMPLYVSMSRASGVTYSYLVITACLSRLRADMGRLQRQNRTYVC